MSKIVRAVNVMIANQNKISDVRRNEEDEIFFVFDSKYTWSIKRNDNKNTFSLYFYPNITETGDLASFEGPEWDDIPFITYQTADLNTKEATDSFSELYTIVKEKVFGVDVVLDDILDNYPPF